MVLRANALGAAFAPSAEASVATGYPWWARINLMLVTAGTHLRLLVVPWGQTTVHGRSPRRPVWHSAAGNRGACARRAVLPPATGYPWSTGRQSGISDSRVHSPSCGESHSDRDGCGRALPVSAQCRDLPAGRRCLCAVAVEGVQGGSAGHLPGGGHWGRPFRPGRIPVADAVAALGNHRCGSNRAAGAHARLALLLLQDVADTPNAPGDPRLRQAEVAVQRALDINPRLAEAWEARALLAIVQQDCAGR